MKVYLIIKEDDDTLNDWVVGVCQSRELAERYIKLHHRVIDDGGKLQYNDFVIEEWDPDKITEASLTEFENAHRFGYVIIVHHHKIISTSSFGMLPDDLDITILPDYSLETYVECKEDELEKAKQIACVMEDQMVYSIKNSSLDITHWRNVLTESIVMDI